MNYLDVLRSGRRHKRKGWEIWYETKDSYGVLDMLADDWEIEEAKIEITTSDLRAAYRRALLSSQHTSPVYGQAARAFVETLAQELGLEPKP